MRRRITRALICLALLTAVAHQGGVSLAAVLLLPLAIALYLLAPLIVAGIAASPLILLAGLWRRWHRHRKLTGPTDRHTNEAPEQPGPASPQQHATTLQTPTARTQAPGDAARLAGERARIHRR